MQEAIDALSELQVRGNRKLRGSSTLLPVFDERESFKTFVRKFNDYLNSKEYEDADDLRIIPSTLRGIPRDAYDQILEARKQNEPWMDLLDDLQNLIYPINTIFNI